MSAQDLRGLESENNNNTADSKNALSSEQVVLGLEIHSRIVEGNPTKLAETTVVEGSPKMLPNTPESKDSGIADNMKSFEDGNSSYEEIKETSQDSKYEELKGRSPDSKYEEMRVRNQDSEFADKTTELRFVPTKTFSKEKVNGGFVFNEKDIEKGRLDLKDDSIFAASDKKESLSSCHSQKMLLSNSSSERNIGRQLIRNVTRPCLMYVFVAFVISIAFAFLLAYITYN